MSGWWCITGCMLRAGLLGGVWGEAAGWRVGVGLLGSVTGWRVGAGCGRVEWVRQQADPPPKHCTVVTHGERSWAALHI